MNKETYTERYRGEAVYDVDGQGAMDMKVDAPGAWERSRTGTREDILRIAAPLFAQRGFEAVTVREISRLAGVGAPTIYHYFGDKQNLYRCVVLDQHLRAGSYLAEALHRVRTAEDFHGWLEILVDNAMDRQDHEKLQLREIIAPDESIRKALAIDGFQPLYDLLREKLNSFGAGVGDGVLPVFLFSAAFGFFTVMPQRMFLANYAPGLDQDDLDRSERSAFKRYLQLCFDETVREARRRKEEDSDRQMAWKGAVEELKDMNREMTDRIVLLERQLQLSGGDH